MARPGRLAIAAAVKAILGATDYAGTITHEPISDADTVEVYAAECRTDEGRIDGAAIECGEEEEPVQERRDHVNWPRLLHVNVFVQWGVDYDGVGSDAHLDRKITAFENAVQASRTFGLVTDGTWDLTHGPLYAPAGMGARVQANSEEWLHFVPMTLRYVLEGKCL